MSFAFYPASGHINALRNQFFARAFPGVLLIRVACDVVGRKGMDMFSSNVPRGGCVSVHLATLFYLVEVSESRGRGGRRREREIVIQSG
jgi:hypothetical protein